ncbi:nitronate monooxygenase [Candidatus Gracilibacteria bacterium]|nr:nitronate monooxygenase [Candidatus Gracilibacteria bacterium]
MIENNETVQSLKERELFQLSEDAQKEWGQIESELFAPKFQSDEEKELFLKECFEGKRKFPWHAQGQSIKVTDTKLVNAVIPAGGIGILGGTGTGRPDYETEMNVTESGDKIPSKTVRIEIGQNRNKEAILKEIEAVRKEHPYAILGVNVLYAIGDFEEIVRAIGDQGMVDVLYVGAGAPYDLSKIMEKYPQMRYMAIVSSAQAVRLLEDTGERCKSKGTRRPDGYVYEDKIAAGHNAIINPRKDKSAADHIREMQAETSKPIIFAGGVKYQEDVQKALLPKEYGGLGVNGVGLGTRVTITDECPIPNETLKDIHLNSAIPVVRREKFSPTGLPSTGKINEKEFWDKVEELKNSTKRRCNDCLIKPEARKNYPELAHCKFISVKPEDADYQFCIGPFLDAAIRGEPWAIYFMSVINEKDPIYLDKNGEARVPTVSEMVGYIIRNEVPEWADKE